MALKGLQRVPWSRLRDAYGPATEIPEFLKDLQSEDAEDREDALSYLYMGTCHQESTIAEASPHVVPFIFQLLQAKKTQDRGRLLDYLGRLLRCPGPVRGQYGESKPQAPELLQQWEAEGQWQEDIHTRVLENAPTLKQLLEAPDRAAQARSQIASKHASPSRTIRVAVGAKQSPNAANEGASTRCGACYVMAQVSYASTFYAPLRDRLKRESHPQVRLALLCAIGALATGESRNARFAQGLLQKHYADTEQEPLERATALVAMGRKLNKRSALRKRIKIDWQQLFMVGPGEAMAIRESFAEAWTAGT